MIRVLRTFAHALLGDIEVGLVRLAERLLAYADPGDLGGEDE